MRRVPTFSFGMVVVVVVVSGVCCLSHVMGSRSGVQVSKQEGRPKRDNEAERVGGQVE